MPVVLLLWQDNNINIIMQPYAFKVFLSYLHDIVDITSCAASNDVYHLIVPREGTTYSFIAMLYAQI